MPKIAGKTIPYPYTVNTFKTKKLAHEIAAEFTSRGARCAVKNNGNTYSVYAHFPKKNKIGILGA